MKRWMKGFIKEMNKLSQRGKLIIGITGSIGSGKTTVLNLLRENGFFGISADEIVKNLLTSKRYYSIILARYPEVADGCKINHRALAHLIFNDKRAKRFVEGVIHPEVAYYIVKEIKKTDLSLIAVEVPLIFELGLEKGFDLTITVFADEKDVIARLLKRGMSLDEIKLRLNNQLPAITKLNMADVVISNDGDIEILKRKVYNLSLALKAGYKKRGCIWRR